jgi:magnesium transporter
VQVLTQVDAERLRRLRAANEFFWLELRAASREDVDRLAGAIGIDPSAAERALRFDEVPQLRRYHGHVGLVFYGAEPAPAGLVEVHLLVSGQWVVTIHEQPCRALDSLREDLAQGPEPSEESVVARILDTLAESFNDFMDPIDATIAELETEAVGAADALRPSSTLRREILSHRGGLWRTRRIVRRQRDYIDRAMDELSDLPGLEPSQRHEFRDVSVEMIRVNDGIDDALDRLGAALDLLNSTISNRMNAIMERLTVVATIFLPLTVVTGFFGMNFAWMTDRIDTLPAFLIFGVGVFLVSAVAISLWVRRRLERQLAE